MRYIIIANKDYQANLDKPNFLKQVGTYMERFNDPERTELATQKRDKKDPKIIRQILLDFNMDLLFEDTEYKEIKPTKDFLEEQIKELQQLKANVLNQLAMKDRAEATELIVTYVKKHEHIYTTRDDLKSEMWIYKNGIYVANGETHIKEFVREVLESFFTTHIASLVIEKIKEDTRIDHDEFYYTNYLWEVPVENGILNLKTREVTPFDPTKVFFNKLPIFYDPKAKCDYVEKHFKAVLKREEDVPAMYELFGYLLFKEYRIEKAVMFVGKGRNGKGKTLELMKRFVGSNNCSNLPLTALKYDNPGLSQLFGKMANICGDLGKTALKDTGTFKESTGRDTIQSKRKYLNDLNFVNYAKMIFSANGLPIVYDGSDGFWDRWLLFEFPYKFMTQPEIDALPEKEKENMKVIDPSIIDKLSQPDELSGLLNKALDGLDEILKNNNFSSTRGTEEIKTFWIRQSDSFMSFCLDCVEEDYEGQITKKLLRKRYQQYCKQHKIKGVSDKSIQITLQNEFGATDTRKYIDQESLNVWEGIKLKSTL